MIQLNLLFLFTESHFSLFINMCLYLTKCFGSSSKYWCFARPVRGICMNVQISSKSASKHRVCLAEPLVLEAGVLALIADNCLTEVCIRRMTREEATPQERGKALEFLLAALVFSLRGKPVCLFIRGISGDFPLFKGIRVDVPITSSLEDWILLPENVAGPDCVCKPLIVSAKWSDATQIVAEESSKSVRTCDPEKCYFAKPKKPVDGAKSIDACAPSAGINLDKRNVALIALRTRLDGWVQVRCEIPRAAPLTEQGWATKPDHVLLESAWLIGALGDKLGKELSDFIARKGFH
jgi:hypothetical protein